MVTREQQYQYEQYMRRQQLLRNYARMVAVSGEKSEEEKKKYPESQEDLRNALSDESVSVTTISAPLSVTNSTFTVESGRTLTVNFENNTITSNGLKGTSTNDDAVFTVKRGGKLILKGQTGGIDCGTDSNAYSAIKLTQKGEEPTGANASIEINGGVYKGQYYSVCGNGGRGDTEVVINGGEFYGTTENDSASMFIPQYGTLTITGGYFSGPTGIWIKSGTTVITGGKIAANGISSSYVYSGSGFNQTGDGLVVDNCGYPGSTPQISVLGGVFTSENAKPIASYSYGKEGEVDRTPISGFVYGGKFKPAIDECLVNEEYKQVPDEEDGWFKVVHR